MQLVNCDVCGRDFERVAAVLAERSSRAHRICSAACANSENGKVVTGAKTHGLSKLPEFAVWKTMIARCHNPNNISYASYGGRGITVCNRWRSDIQSFISDMGLRPSPDHSIERIHNGGDYEPGNCRWATREEQGRNKRNNRIYKIPDGRRLTVADIARESGIKFSTMYARLVRHGMTVEQAVAMPVRDWGDR